MVTYAQVLHIERMLIEARIHFEWFMLLPDDILTSTHLGGIFYKGQDRYVEITQGLDKYDYIMLSYSSESDNYIMSIYVPSKTMRDRIRVAIAKDTKND